MSQPFEIRAGEQLYGTLGIDPFASTEEISEVIGRIAEQLSGLSDAEKSSRLQEIQRIATILNDPAKRVQLNALLPERIDAKSIAALLARIDTLSPEQLVPPSPSIADVYTEGLDRQLLEEVLIPIDPIQDLELDFTGLNTILSNSVKDRELYIDS